MQGASRVQVYLLFFAVALATCVLFVGMQGAEAEDTSEETHADGHAHEHGTPAPEDHELRLNENLSLYESLGLESEPASAQTEPVPGNFTTGGFTSKNVEYVGFLPFEEGSGEPVPGQPQEIVSATGANIRGDYLYLTSWKAISIYDISDPLHPKLTAYQPVGFMFENENVATNGEILLFSAQLPDGTLHVYDVSDKSKITEIATIEGAGDHTTTCILDCRWAYGSDGSITDLRDPSNPRLTKRNWHKLTGLNEDGAHDVDEFKNGFLVTSPISDDMQLLDVRDPLRPKVLARGAHPTPRSAFLPHAGSTSAAYWLNRNIVYAVDYTRGIDILRFTGRGTDGPLTGANDRGIGRG